MKLTYAAALFFSLILTLGCTGNDKITLVESTGRINHLLVVMDNSDWHGEIGDAIRDILVEPVVGLPQDEPQFSANQVNPGEFNSLFKRTRNILFVGVDDGEQNFYANYDIYANPQTTLTVLGKDDEDLLKNIALHKEEIISTFKDKDLSLYQSKITKDLINTKDVETFNKLGFDIKIPRTYNMVEDNGDFLWYRYDFTKGLLNLIAFEIPYHHPDDFKAEHILALTDSITKTNIPGQFEDTYLKIEPLFKPVVKETVLADLPTLEFRGLWVTHNDFMGGPFVSYAMLDKANHRILIIEGFSYSPATKKRDFVFEMEAILKTVSLLD